jgi:hypothetical protein
MIDELRTLPHPPDVLHLDIGMTGQLHTYKLITPGAKRQKPKPPTLKEKIKKFL